MDATISLFNTLFYVSMCVAAMGLALAIFFFFYFDIPTVYAMMTGKARMETVRRMSEQNAKTGKLRGNTDNVGKSGRTGRTARTGRNAKVRSGEVVHPVAPAQQSAPAEYRPETSVLSVQAPETSVLGSNSAETAILTPGGNHADYQASETAVLRPEVREISFRMTETTLVIHTNEII